MSLKISQLLQIQDVLAKLSNTPMPAKLAYSTSRILKQIARVVYAASQSHMALYKSLGVLDEASQMMNIPDDKLEEFKVGNDAILNTDVPLELYGLSIESFGDVAVTPAMMLALEPVLRAQHEQ